MNQPSTIIELINNNSLIQTQKLTNQPSINNNHLSRDKCHRIIHQHSLYLSTTFTNPETNVNKPDINSHYTSQ